MVSGIDVVGGGSAIDVVREGVRERSWGKASGIKVEEVASGNNPERGGGDQGRSGVGGEHNRGKASGDGAENRRSRGWRRS